MKYLKLFAVFGALALVGAGSATLIDVFGTISGTADVDSSMHIKEVQWDEGAESDYEYVVIENRADQQIDVSDILIGDSSGSDEDSLSGVEFIQSGQTAIITGNEVSSTGQGYDIHLVVDDKAIAGSGLNNQGETVYLKLDGNRIYEKNYEGEQ